MFNKKLFLTVLLVTSFLFSQKKVACVGNSITMGALLTNPSTESYPAQLQQLLGSGYVVYNYGIGNRVLLNGFAYSYNISSKYFQSISQHHDIIIICLGTNDTQTEYHIAINNFINDYKLLIYEYENSPNQLSSPILILGIPPPIFATYDGHSNVYLVDEIIPRIKTITNQTNNSIANFYNALINNEELFIDGVHPNVDGAYIMAVTAKSAIDKALNPPPETPTNFTASATINEVYFNWDANTESDLSNYILYRGIVDGGWKDVLATIDKNNTSYTDTNVETHTTYYYQMSAQNTSNNLSDRTNQVSATPGGPPDSTPPSTPTNFNAVSYNEYILLSWDSNVETDISTYTLYRGTIDGGWKDYLATSDKTATNYLDDDINANTTYFYQIDAVDIIGNHSDRSSQINTTTLDILNDAKSRIFSLNQNIPNPFNPITMISYIIPNDSHVNIAIYDLMGNKVKTVLNEFKYIGKHTLIWDGTDNLGEKVSGGIYFYKLQAGNFTQTRKMVLLK